MLEFVAVQVGEDSRWGCAKCAPLTTGAYFPLDTIRAAIDGALAGPQMAPGLNLLITGPEPFGHPELPAIVAACREAGAERIGISTDACAMSMPSNAAGVLSAGVRHLFVRTVHADPVRGDALAGHPGRIRDAMRGIAAYLAASSESGTTVAVTAVVPVCTHNLGDLPLIVSELAGAGVHAARLVKGGALPGSAEALVSAACDTGIVNHMWVETDGALPLAPSHYLHAVPGGDYL